MPPGDENYSAQIHYHRLGEAQEGAALVYERPGKKELFSAPAVTRDGRWLVVSVFKGSSGKSEVYVQDRNAPGSRFTSLFTGFADAVSFVDEVDGRFFFQTDGGAPLGRLVAIDLGKGETQPGEVCPRGRTSSRMPRSSPARSWPCGSTTCAAGSTFTASTARPRGTIELPALGTVSGLNGEPDEDELFLGFTSYTYPTTP